MLGLATDTIRHAFATHIGAAILVDEAMAPCEMLVFGTSEASLEEYNRHWRGADPVLDAVLTHRGPVHAQELVSLESWRRSAIYRGYGARLRIEHYMSAPIFGTHGQIGLLNFCRRPQDRAFGSKELRLASAFCGIVSAAFACLPDDNETSSAPFSRRERQISLLAARGKNNAEIAAQLGIARETVKQTLRRAYRKADVSGRAEMAAKLAKWKWL